MEVPRRVVEGAGEREARYCGRSICLGGLQARRAVSTVERAAIQNLDATAEVKMKKGAGRSEDLAMNSTCLGIWPVSSAKAHLALR